MSKLDSAQVPPAVLEVIRGLHAGGFRAFLVGGCVRDLLRGQKPKDFDVASSATPQQVQRLFKKVIPTGIEHGTVTVLAGGGNHVEVTTFRAEAEYVDGRRPSKVEFHEDIDADLSRRDFTMNAIAWDPARDELVDPFDGQGDLQRRTVRCVRKALDRFSEDGLRPLRAVRFATVLDFEVEPETEAAIPQTLEVFKKVAAERVHQEFVKLLMAPAVERGLRLLQRTGLLGVFFPEAVVGSFSAVARAPADEVVRLALLCLGLPGARAVLQRLKFPTKTCDEAGAVAQLTSLPLAETSDVDRRRFLAKVTVDRAARAVVMHRALGADEALLTALERVISARPPTTTRELALNGQAIMGALGTGPSPAVGHATRYLLDCVLENPADNDPETLKKLLAGWTPP
ncbi:MAG: [cytidine(C)-cytidine(C)-adenosine (A)]-adding enzyme [Myxococcaceae bacterium]